MKKDNATNTFENGLIKDYNPIMTPAGVLTDCLNGTFITYNGNENALLNDMGNGRVTTAELPEGYVPLGTCELGGIIYIVSFNPQTNKSLIGSFPSPQRNVSSNSENSGVSLGIDDFLDKESNSVKSITKIVQLSTDNLAPGDLYKIFGGSFETEIYTSYINGKEDIKYIKLSLGYLNSEGKVIDLTSGIIYNNGYFIETNYADTKEGEIINYDSYINSVSSLYNVFTGLNSGKLVLIATLEIPDTFTCSWDADVDNEEVTIKFYVNWTSDRVTNANYINPWHILINNEPFIINSKDSSNELTYPLSVQNISIDTNTPVNNEIYIEHDNHRYDTNRKNDGTDEDECVNVVLPVSTGEYKYEVCPSVYYDENDYAISNLAVSGIIDVKKIGSGQVDLISYRYLSENDYILLTFGTSVYLEKNKKATGITINFYEVDDSIKDCESLDDYKLGIPDKTFPITGRNSYSGDFTYKIYYDEDFINNRLYLVTFDLDLNNGDSRNLGKRLLYTNGVFNSAYYSCNDFDELKLSDYLTVNKNFVCEISNPYTQVLKLVSVNGDECTISKSEYKTGLKFNTESTLLLVCETTFTTTLVPSCTFSVNDGFTINLDYTISRVDSNSISTLSLDTSIVDNSSEQITDNNSSEKVDSNNEISSGVDDSIDKEVVSGDSNESVDNDNKEISSGSGNETVDSGNDKEISSGNNNETVDSGNDKEISTGSGNETIDSGDNKEVVSGTGGNETVDNDNELQNPDVSDNINDTVDNDATEISDWISSGEIDRSIGFVGVISNDSYLDGYNNSGSSDGNSESDNENSESDNGTFTNRYTYYNTTLGTYNNVEGNKIVLNYTLQPQVLSHLFRKLKISKEEIIFQFKNNKTLCDYVLNIGGVDVTSQKHGNSGKTCDYKLSEITMMYSYIRANYSDYDIVHIRILTYDDKSKSGGLNELTFYEGNTRLGGISDQGDGVNLYSNMLVIRDNLNTLQSVMYNNNVYQADSTGGTFPDTNLNTNLNNLRIYSTNPEKKTIDQYTYNSYICPDDYTDTQIFEFQVEFKPIIGINSISDIYNDKISNLTYNKTLTFDPDIVSVPFKLRFEDLILEQIQNSTSNLIGVETGKIGETTDILLVDNSKSYNDSTIYKASSNNTLSLFTDAFDFSKSSGDIGFNYKLIAYDNKLQIDNVVNKNSNLYIRFKGDDDELNVHCIKYSSKNK